MHANTANVDPRSQTVAIVVYDGLSLFEFAAACDVFGPSSAIEPDRPWYRLVVCATAPSITLENGLRIEVVHGLDQLRAAHTIVVPPCGGGEVSVEVLQALRRAHDAGARLLSLCTGAFVLAAAGLLDGRRATTHWRECADLARRFPAVTVDPDVLYVDGGDILTSAGSAASIDLCLHVVRQDHGAEVAALLARQLVVPPYRDGGQAQYIDTPLPEVDGTDLLTDTIAWLQRHLDQPVTIEELADRSAMSRRTFARRFAATTGTTPYRWLLRQRIQLAQRMLETTDLSIDQVAQRSGFINAGNLRKHFGRMVRTTPQSYRHTFASRERTPVGLAVRP
jgi:AraC family transcriptional regulator, transcriptional activator FtrA